MKDKIQKCGFLFGLISNIDVILDNSIGKRTDAFGAFQHYLPEKFDERKVSISLTLDVKKKKDQCDESFDDMLMSILQTQAVSETYNLKWLSLHLNGNLSAIQQTLASCDAFLIPLKLLKIVTSDRFERIYFARNFVLPKIEETQLHFLKPEKVSLFRILHEQSITDCSKKTELIFYTDGKDHHVDFDVELDGLKHPKLDCLDGNRYGLEYMNRIKRKF